MNKKAFVTVQSLGHFRVWRHNGEEIADSDWGREKARLLFQYLITRRGEMTPKERIAFDLWPGLDAERSDRDFKVALNAIMRTLEPERGPRAPSRFIERQATAYLLIPSRYDLDADRFVELVNNAARAERRYPDRAIDNYRSAISLYQGDFLPGALYEDWTSSERERLLTLFLSSASRLAALLLERRNYQEAITLAESVVARDACWEEAYRVLMRAHQQRGNRPLAVRAYRRCLQALQSELGLEPMPETKQLFQSLIEH